MSTVQNTPVEMLRVKDLHAFYGESHILHGVDLRRAAVSRTWRNSF